MQRSVLAACRSRTLFLPPSLRLSLVASFLLLQSPSWRQQQRQQQWYSRRFNSTTINNSSSNTSNGDAPATAAAVLRTALPPSEFPERSLLKCIEKEIDDEAMRLDKEEGPPPPPSGWEMYHAPGTSLFYGRRWWLPPTAVAQHPEKDMLPRVMERHTLRVQLTTRDPSLDPECNVRGEHFPFSFFVQRIAEGTAGVDSSFSSPMRADNNWGEGGERSLYEQSIEVRADFVDGELVIDNVLFHGTFKIPSTLEKGKTETETEVCYNNIFSGYPGPNLDEAEEEVLDGLQAWLAERCIDDQFGEFVGQYSVWVEQMEYERWLQQLRDFVAA